MRQNILLRQCTTPKRVCLPNETILLLRYDRVSRRNLPSNITIRRARTIGTRNRCTTRKKVSSIATQDKAKRMVKKKYRNQKRRKAQKGGSLIRSVAGNLANLGATF